MLQLKRVCFSVYASKTRFKDREELAVSLLDLVVSLVGFPSCSCGCLHGSLSSSCLVSVCPFSVSVITPPPPPFFICFSLAVH